MGDKDDPDDVMETSLTIDYAVERLNQNIAIGWLDKKHNAFSNREGATFA